MGLSQAGLAGRSFGRMYVIVVPSPVLGDKLLQVPAPTQRLPLASYHLSTRANLVRLLHGALLKNARASRTFSL